MLLGFEGEGVEVDGTRDTLHTSDETTGVVLVSLDGCEVITKALA